VANVAYQVMKTYQHRYIIPTSICVSVIALAGCQLLAERVFDLSTTVSVIINFIGGVYFLYLLLRENKSW
jgi:iron complex transport system permease protein